MSKVRSIVSSRVEPDAVVVLEGDAPAPENHRIICRGAGHFSQGMVGILVVAP
jgi:uncharacterized cupredoxin-like copper-binding protein